MTTTVTHDEAQEAFATLCETAACGVAPAATLQLYLRAQRAANARTRALREAAERLLDVINWGAIDEPEGDAAVDALRSALAAETSGRDGGGNG